MPHPFSFCLCADDYAMTPGVSRGIRDALAAGALTATSVMTTSPYWPDEAAALDPFRTGASIGLHLNLTLGRPLAPMPRFAPFGTFPDIGTLASLSWRGKLPLDEIAAEIDRQLERFAEVSGRPPDHLDGHQHVHVLAGVRPQVFAALRRFGWLPWLRNCADHPTRILRRRTNLKKALGVAWLSRGFRSESELLGFKSNQGFAGFSSFDTEESYARTFEDYLTAPGARHLVMCHPGYVDDILRGLDPVVESRENELGFLCSPAFPELLHKYNATLI